MSRSVPRAGGRLAILVVVGCLLAAVVTVSPASAADPTPQPPGGFLRSGPAPRVARAAPTARSGFQDTVVLNGLVHPTNIEFAPDGRVFVAEKRGRVQVFDSLASSTPRLFAGFDAEVYDYWDRGLLGMTLSPNFGAAGVTSYVYVSYTYDHILGDPPGARWNDACPKPAGATTYWCTASARLSRFPVEANGLAGPEQVLVEDWCQQFPSHSVGDLAFGPDGMLYVSAGEAASFATTDYGQFGNPCGDPVDEGGSLRAQSVRRPATEPRTLDGAILRLDPQTGLAAPGNPLAASTDLDARRIIAHGVRNPFRFTFRPGTGELWIGDVGQSAIEEVDRLATPTTLTNFGWPCFEGNPIQPGWQAADKPLCRSLYPPNTPSTASPYFSYVHNVAVVPGETCPTANGSVISGVAFYNGGPYPQQYDGALFFADHSRNCIWAMLPAVAGGLPSPGQIETFVAGAANPVDLEIGPLGDLFYVDHEGGAIHRVASLGPNNPPSAVASANPLTGTAPLRVTFDGSHSSDPDGRITYDWNFGDGSAHSTAVSPIHTYAAGTFTATLTVTDDQGASDTASVTVSSSNTAPVPSIDSPTAALQWSVGDAIAFSGSATDAEDGSEPASRLSWQLVMHHCTTVTTCHTHLIQQWTGAAAGTFDAPDHEYPSYLELVLTATDSKNVSTTTSVRLDPKTVDLTFRTNPTGGNVTVGTYTAAAPFARRVIVGSRLTVIAPTTDLAGGEPTAFVSWSDGGARIHEITAPSTPATYEATLRPTDVANTCATALPAPVGKWISEKIDVPGDVDWFRFSIPATAYGRVVLGRLDADLRLDLYSSCSTLVAGSGSAGITFESLYRRLPAGTYRLKVSARAGGVSTVPYALRFRTLSESVQVLSSTSWLAGGRRTIVGEVLNNTSAFRRWVTVRANLYSATNRLLGTTSIRVYASVLNPRTQAPFRLVFTPPTGYDHYTLTVTSVITTVHSLPGLVVAAGVRDVDSAGRLHVRGTLKNSNAYAVRLATVSVTLLDNLGAVQNVVLVYPPSRTLRPGASTTFEAILPDHNAGYQAVELRPNAAR